MGKRQKRLSMAISDDDMELIDKVCKQLSITKSEFFRNAIRTYCNTLNVEEPSFRQRKWRK